MYRRQCYKLYCYLEKKICPGLKFAQCMYENRLFSLVNESTDWLDLGCGRKLLPDWRNDKEIELVSRCRSVVGIDLDKNSIGKHRTIKSIRYGSIESIPFGDCHFNLATCNMVLEHVSDPEKFFSEAYRVLRPGGLLVVHTPNLRSYTTLAARALPENMKSVLVHVLQGREDDDIFRTYYRSNTLAAIGKYSENAGFILKKLEMWCSSAQFIVFPPIVFLELLYIRFLMSGIGKDYRSNIFALLQKP